MDKLTINELAIALVNGQKICHFDDERELNQICKIVELREEEMTIANGEYQYDVKFDDVKILLHDLSSLTEYREDLGFVPIVRLSGLDSLKGKITYGYEHRMYWVKLQIEKSSEFVCKTFPSDVNSMEFWVIQQLYHWHIDLHNLIDRNLAINIKTLKK